MPGWGANFGGLQSNPSLLRALARPSGRGLSSRRIASYSV
jgi:hypothetical protein